MAPLSIEQMKSIAMTRGVKVVAPAPAVVLKKIVPEDVRVTEQAEQAESQSYILEAQADALLEDVRRVPVWVWPVAGVAGAAAIWYFISSFK